MASMQSLKAGSAVRAPATSRRSTVSVKAVSKYAEELVKNAVSARGGGPL